MRDLDLPEERIVVIDPLLPDDPDDLDVTIGYSDDVTDLARAVEFGGANTSPGGQLGTALNREAPRFAKMVGKVGAAVWRS